MNLQNLRLGLFTCLCLSLPTGCAETRATSGRRADGGASYDTAPGVPTTGRATGGLQGQTTRAAIGDTR